MITEGVKKREFAANYEGSYSDYSDAFSTNTPLLPPCPLLPPRQWRVFSVPREWCQHGPLKTAAVCSEMNALAEHNGPNLNTTRIYARSEPPTKEKRATLLLFKHAVILLVVNLLHPFIAFVVFQVFMEFETHGRPDRVGPFFWTEFYFCWHVTETPCSCLCLTADLHGLGQPLPRQVRTQASNQGPANRRHGRSAAGWDHTGRR